MTDHKSYLDEQYKLAVLDFQTAHTEDEQWNARKRMAQVERTASELSKRHVKPQPAQSSAGYKCQDAQASFFLYFPLFSKSKKKRQPEAA